MVVDVVIMVRDVYILSTVETENTYRKQVRPKLVVAFHCHCFIFSCFFGFCFFFVFHFAFFFIFSNFKKFKSFICQFSCFLFPVWTPERNNRREAGTVKNVDFLL